MLVKNSFVVLGSSGSGKTQLVNVVLGIPFNETHAKPELFRFNIIKTGNNELNTSIHHEVWDLSGGDKYEKSAFMYLRIAKQIAFCIDLSQPIDEPEIRRIIGESQRCILDTVPFILVGTKSDLVKGNPQLILDNINIDDLFHGSKPKRVVTSAKHRTGLDNFLQCIHEAVPTQHLQRSRFEEAEKALLSQLDHLPQHNKTEIVQQLAILKSALLSDNTSIEKTNAINLFTSNCHTSLKGKNAKVLKAALTLAAVATVTLLAGIIGFSIGLIAGAWLGPASFLTALATGSAAAIAVVTVSTSLGLIGGGITFFQSGSSTREQTKELNQFVEKVRPQT